MGRDGRSEARGEKTRNQPVGCSPGGPGGCPTCHVAQHLDGRAWEGVWELSLTLVGGDGQDRAGAQALGWPPWWTLFAGECRSPSRGR